MGIQAFRFQEYLVRCLVRKTMDLVLDGWAVTRPHSFDDPTVHGRTVQTATDDFVRAGIGMRDPARQLARVHGGLAQEREHRHGIKIAGLLFQHTVVDAASVDARRRASFQAALRKLQLLEPLAQGIGGRIPCPPSGIVLQPHVNQTVEEGPSRQHHGTGTKAQPDLRNGAHHLVALHHQIVHRLLEQPEVGLVLELCTYGVSVQHPVGLGTRGTYRWPLGAVENTELDTCLVGGDSHRAAQRIDFLDQMTLAYPPDGGIAGHLAQGLDIVGKQQCLCAGAGCSQGCLRTGVTATNDDHIKFAGKIHDGER
ncbi:Uncharacterised protein [Bordetella pertussis]|nr:Uncharacterised protein [Bordetella pertussis]